MKDEQKELIELPQNCVGENQENVSDPFFVPYVVRWSSLGELRGSREVHPEQFYTLARIRIASRAHLTSQAEKHCSGSIVMTMLQGGRHCGALYITTPGNRVRTGVWNSIFEGRCVVKNMVEFAVVEHCITVKHEHHKSS